MTTILWTGKLSNPMMVLINANNILAWIIGSTRNTKTMKERVQKGYEGKFSEDVMRYDELAAGFQTRAAVAQLEGMDLQGKEVLDVAGGSGIISFLALQKGASRVVCGDISEYMLNLGRAKAEKLGYGPDRIQFHWLDAENLPFQDASFDYVVTGMSLGLFPDQKKAVSEMVRVLRPGSLVSVGAHGPEHYWEACDAILRAASKRNLLGYRFEYWPRKEEAVRQLMIETGLEEIWTARFIWRNLFKSGEDAYDFFAAVSSNFWLDKVPINQRDKEDNKIREYFSDKRVVTITDDVINAYGRKPL
jgi:ubiquinone/menaquinone biosynthesis C-methylase UbiE